MSNTSLIIPDNITYNDLKHRLQNIQCCLPNKAVELYNRINLGINCCNEEAELNVAMAYLDMLKCYITDWQTPYKYELITIEGPTASISVAAEFDETPYDANSPIFNGFYIDITGYGISYISPVSMNTVISDYIAATGQNMSIVSIVNGTKTTTFNLLLQVPCEYANSTALIVFVYNTVLGTQIKVDFGPCVNNIISIIGPTYTSQDSANCLSREEVVNMFEWLQKYCCMCFPNYGNYDNVTTIN